MRCSAGKRRPFSPALRWGRLIPAIVLLFWQLPAALAGTGLRATLPAGRRAPLCGVRLTVDPTWVHGSGYHPVRLVVKPAGTTTFPADRRFTIELAAIQQSREDAVLRASQVMELPQGAAEAKLTMYLPRRPDCRQIHVTVFEDGRPIPELTRSLPLLSQTHGQNWLEGLPTILFVDRDAPPLDQRMQMARFPTAGGDEAREGRLPEVRQFVSVFLPLFDHFEQAAQAPRGRAWAEITGSMPNVELLAPADLPLAWLGYSSVDMLYVNAEDLQLLKARYPPQWRALMQWISSGGNLLTTGAGDDFSRLSAVEATLDLPPDRHRRGREGAEALPPGWEFPDRSSYGRVAGPYDHQTLAADVTWHLPKHKRLPETPPFALRPARCGIVVAFAADDPFPGDAAQWWWLLTTLEPQQWLWYQRHGLSLTRQNSGFWNFLIPGVGLAPVGVFQILISLFAAVIGPLNFFLLKRWNRASWLVVTIPLSALLVTMGLILFAVFSDGLGVRVRVRSMTLLDQSTGQAVTWSRQAYYAGLAPGRGLLFPADTAVYPLEQLPPQPWRHEGPPQILDWQPEQRLASGYLTSRMTSQFLLVRSRSTGLRLEVKADEGQALNVTNELQSHIQQLYVVDDEGQLWVGEDLAAGTRQRLVATPADLAEQSFARLMQRHKLQLPEDFDQASYRSVARMGRGGRGYYNYRLQGTVPDAEQSDSILERWLAEFHEDGPTALGPNSFIAVVDRCVETPLGVRRPRESDSLYLVVGRWEDDRGSRLHD